MRRTRPQRAASPRRGASLTLVLVTLLGLALGDGSRAAEQAVVDLLPDDPTLEAGAGAEADAGAAGAEADAGPTGAAAEADAGPTGAEADAGPAGAEADAGPAGEEPPAEPAAAEAGGGEDELPKPSGAPPLAAPELALLQAAWREVRADLARQAWVEAAGRHAHLVSVRDDLGVANLQHLSAVYVHAAGQAADAGATDAAEALADAAAAVSPDLAAPRFDKARHTFRRTPFALSDEIRELRAGFERLGRDLPAALAVGGNLLTGATLVLVVLLLGFAVAMVSRYGRFAANDLRRLLPRGVTPGQAGLLLAVVLVAPLLAGLGVLATLLLWIAATAPYQRVTERVTALGLLLAVGTLPVVTSYVVRTLQFPATPEAVLHECNTGLCPAEWKERVRTWANTNVLPYESNFTMALVQTRLAALGQDARREAGQFARVANDTEETPESLTLLGNQAYLDALGLCRDEQRGLGGAAARVEEKQREALALWEAALGLDPGYLPALYNSHVVSVQLGAEASAAERLERAMDADTAAVLRWNKQVAREGNILRCRMTAQGNRHLMPPALPPARLARLTLARDVPHDALVLPFGGWLAGRLSPTALGVGALAGAGLAILLWLLAGVLRPSRACAECGSVADPRTRLDLHRGAVCRRCLLIDIRRAFVDAKEQWFREKEREAEVARRAGRARLVTWFLPGFGHMLRGAPIRGVVFLGVITASVIGAFALHTMVVRPEVPTAVGAGRLVVFGVVAAMAWLVAVLDAYTGGPSR